MENIVAKVVEAHGGLDHWQKLKQIRFNVSGGGDFYELVHLPQDLTTRQVTAWLHKERVCFRPFGAPDHYADFFPDRVVVKTDSGETVMERRGTPGELHYQLTKEAWDPLDTVTFSGYTMWTYSTTPFFMMISEFQVIELSTWQEKEETWYRLKIEFPSNILSHCPLQYFYFGEDFLLRRHDYYIEVAGGFWASQYAYDIIEVDGIKLPTRSRAYKRNDEGQPIHDQLLIRLDFTNIKFV